MDTRPGAEPSRRGPSPLSVGMQWATTITTIGLEMALPPLAGVWLDGRYKTGPWWTLAFSALGFAVAMRHLWQLAQRLNARRPDGRRPPGAP